jgi:hypothetical protein
MRGEIKMASIREAIEAICDDITKHEGAADNKLRTESVMALVQAETLLSDPEPEPIDWKQAAQVLKEFCAAHTAEQCDICPLSDWCNDETDLSTLYWKESDR